MRLEATLVEIVEDGSAAPPTRRVSLAEYLTPEREEQAATEANTWIKSLRHIRVRGASLRDALSHRGDSLWWFVELYLHKRGRITAWHRAALATEVLCDHEHPRQLRWLRGDAGLAAMAAQVARARHVPMEGVPAVHRWRLRLETERQSYLWAWLALFSRLKPRPQPAARTATATAVAVGYVHSAFWRPGPDDGGEEGYVGPTLAALERRVGRDAVMLIGLGPSTNFRARSWRSVLATETTGPERVTPVEAFAPWSAMRPSRALWRRRRLLARALMTAEVRHATRIRGSDLWPLVAEELRGVALLQLPWSARAMDEAGASLDQLKPAVAFTYAEAGGWGRALMLEARRRGVPTVGLQHGFIYRHWLNYLHEADEMSPSAGNPADQGFPRPTVTLLFDGFAEAHLRHAGSFPAEAMRVTGSPARDRLVAGRAAVTPAAVDAARRQLAIAAGEDVVLVVSKASQIGPHLPMLLEAAERIGGVRVVIKPHPAETAEQYRAVREHRTLCMADTVDLVTLVAMARLLVTVHSTVAVDALVLGLPVLVLGLPTNLTPFVDAGAMAGARTAGEIEPALVGLLRNDAARASLADASRTFVTRYAIRTDGSAADRAAEVLGGMAAPTRHGGSQ